MSEDNWRMQASCHGMATKDYDPWSSDDRSYHPNPQAESVCRHCPVRRECLTDALETGEPFVRGGLTRPQREALKRPRSRKRCPICMSTGVAPLDVNLQVCSSCGHAWFTTRMKKKEVLAPHHAKAVAKSALLDKPILTRKRPKPEPKDR